MRRVDIVLLMVGLWISLPQAFANEIQSHDSIRQVVRDHLSARVGGEGDRTTIQIAAIDRRLRLQQCDQPLETFLLPNAKEVGPLLVGVRCNGSRQWKLFVRAEVDRLVDVVVATRTLARGSRIGAGDIQKRQLSESKAITGYMTQPDEIIGKTLVRTVSSGSPVTPSSLGRERAIKRGEKVAIVARLQGMKVSMEGMALSDGAVGEVIRVKNRSSKREIDAEVIAGGVVQVRM